MRDKYIYIFFNCEVRYSETRGGEGSALNEMCKMWIVKNFYIHNSSSFSQALLTGLLSVLLTFLNIGEYFSDKTMVHLVKHLGANIECCVKTTHILDWLLIH